jgi:hypothetical protein
VATDLNAQMPREPKSPGLEFFLQLKVAIGPTLDLGPGPAGVRRTVPITGGTFAGPLMRGIVLPGGADWQIAESESLTFVDAQYVIETDDGVRIQVRNSGTRHGPPEVLRRIAAGEPVAADEYYFRTSPRFFPPHGRYDWLRQSVFVASAERSSDLVVVNVWKIL